MIEKALNMTSSHSQNPTESVQGCALSNWDDPETIIWVVAFCLMQILVICLSTKLRILYRNERNTLYEKASEEAKWDIKSKEIKKNIEESTYSYTALADRIEDCDEVDLEMGDQSNDDACLCENAQNENVKRRNDGFQAISPTCSICLDEYDDDSEIVVMKNCNHAFHKFCLQHWMIQQRRESCPYCRQSFQLTQEVTNEEILEVLASKVNWSQLSQHVKVGSAIALMEIIFLGTFFVKMSGCW